MIKKISVILLLSISCNLIAQESPWAVEAKFTPFFLGAINSEKEFGIKSDGISGGFNTGITIRRYLSASWSLEAGSMYSSQKFNGIRSGSVPEGSQFTNSLEYYKFPLLVNYDWSLNYKEDLKLTLGGGGQILHLIDYKVIREDRLQIITIENGKRVLYIKDEDLIKSVIKDDFFTNNRLGLVGHFGIEKRISESFTYFLKLKTEYDLNIIDNDNSYNYDLSYFRIGLEFGIRYRFKKTAPLHVEGIL